MESVIGHLWISQVLIKDKPEPYKLIVFNNTSFNIYGMFNHQMVIPISQFFKVMCNVLCKVQYFTCQNNIMSEQILVCADMCEYFLTLIPYSQKFLRYVYFAVES